MKFAGYDIIIITGRAPQPTVVTIKDDMVEFRPAQPKYWGMKTSEIEQALRDDFDENAKVLSIGPAGEQKIPWACVSTDQYHKAGRGGHGALLGRQEPQGRRHPRHRLGERRRRQGVPGRPLAHPRRVRPHRRQLLGARRRHAGAGRPRQRRRRIPHAQLVRGRVRGRRQHQLRVVPEDPPQEARLLPVRHRLPQLPRRGAGRRDGAGRGPGVRDHRALRRQLRYRRHRRARQVQRALRRVGHGHHLVGLGARSRHGYDREGHQRLRRALRRRRELPQGARAHGDAHRRGRGTGARLEAPGREVRRARAGHGGQEPRAARATTPAAPSA